LSLSLTLNVEPGTCERLPKEKDYLFVVTRSVLILS